MASESPDPVTPQDVLDKLMYDGTFDNLRSSLISLLKSNDDLKSFILTSVEQSQVLKTADLETKSKRQLMEELRQELSSSVLERASHAAWRLMLSEGGIGNEITAKVDATYCELAGLPYLGCDCHGFPSKDSQLTSASSAVIENRKAMEPEATKEVPTQPIPVDNLEQDSPMEKESVEGKAEPMEDVRSAPCSVSSEENASKSQKEGNWNMWMGSSETIHDPQKLDPAGAMFL